MLVGPSVLGFLSRFDLPLDRFDLLFLSPLKDRTEVVTLNPVYVLLPPHLLVPLPPVFGQSPQDLLVDFALSLECLPVDDQQAPLLSLLLHLLFLPFVPHRAFLPFPRFLHFHLLKFGSPERLLLRGLLRVVVEAREARLFDESCPDQHFLFRRCQPTFRL
jgi:hypothetical protein